MCGLAFLRDIRAADVDKFSSMMRYRDVKRQDVDD